MHMKGHVWTARINLKSNSVLTSKKKNEYKLKLLQNNQKKKKNHAKEYKLNSYKLNFSPFLKDVEQVLKTGAQVYMKFIKCKSSILTEFV